MQSIPDKPQHTGGAQGWRMTGTNILESGYNEQHYRWHFVNELLHMQGPLLNCI